jgi:hypothetical protein
VELDLITASRDGRLLHLAAEEVQVREELAGLDVGGAPF